MTRLKQKTSVIAGVAVLTAAGVAFILVRHKPADSAEALPAISSQPVAVIRHTIREEDLPEGMRPPDVSEEDKNSILRWRQMPLTPLTQSTEISVLVDKIPVDGLEIVSLEARAKLRNSLKAFFAYASSNSFDTYTNFLGITPDVKYQMSESLKAQVHAIFTNEPLDLNGQVPLARYFELKSFGTIGRKDNYWHGEAAGFEEAGILIFTTNRLEDSFVSPFANQVFHSAAITTTNYLFIWPHSKDDLLARDGKLTAAVAKVFLKTTGSDYAYPVFLAFFWDTVDNRWIPDEMDVRATVFPSPRPLFF